MARLAEQFFDLIPVPIQVSHHGGVHNSMMAIYDISSHASTTKRASI